MSPKKSNKPNPKNPYDKRNNYRNSDIRHHLMKTKNLLRKKNKSGTTYAIAPKAYIAAPDSPLSRPPTPLPVPTVARKLDYELKMATEVTPCEKQSKIVESSSKGEDPPVPIVFLEHLPPVETNDNKLKAVEVEMKGNDDLEEKVDFTLPFDVTMEEAPKNLAEDDDFFIARDENGKTIFRVSYGKYEELMKKRHTADCDWKGVYQIVDEHLKKAEHNWDFDKTQVIKYSLESVETGPPVILNGADGQKMEIPAPTREIIDLTGCDNDMTHKDFNGMFPYETRRIQSKKPVMTKKIELVNDGKEGVWQEVMKMEETYPFLLSEILQNENMKELHQIEEWVLFKSYLWDWDTMGNPDTNYLKEMANEEALSTHRWQELEKIADLVRKEEIEAKKSERL